MLTTNQAGKTRHVHLASQFFRQQEIRGRTAGTEALSLYFKLLRQRRGSQRIETKERNKVTRKRREKVGEKRKKATSQQACGFPVRNSAGGLLPNLSINGHSRDFVPLRDENQSRDSTGAAYLPIS